jgi:hypothetical protein
MKIAVTVTGCRQVGIDAYRDWHRTRVFDDTASIREMMAWAKATDERAVFSDLLFSEVDDAQL